jgi:hypothetical protein
MIPAKARQPHARRDPADHNRIPVEFMRACSSGYFTSNGLQRCGRGAVEAILQQARPIQSHLRNSKFDELSGKIGKCSHPYHGQRNPIHPAPILHRDRQGSPSRPMNCVAGSRPPRSKHVRSDSRNFSAWPRFNRQLGKHSYNQDLDRGPSIEAPTSLSPRMP